MNRPCDLGWTDSCYSRCLPLQEWCCGWRKWGGGIVRNEHYSHKDLIGFKMKVRTDRKWLVSADFSESWVRVARLVCRNQIKLHLFSPLKSQQNGFPTDSTPGYTSLFVLIVNESDCHSRTPILLWPFSRFYYSVVYFYTFYFILIGPAFSTSHRCLPFPVTTELTTWFCQTGKYRNLFHFCGVGDIWLILPLLFFFHILVYISSLIQNLYIIY